MRLLSIELSNFQVHGETTIEFAPITTIKGPTDTGKSSIIRALRWVCLNDLAGFEFIKEGEKKTKVTLRFYRNKMEWDVARIKSISSTGINTYKLNDKEFKSFGMSVPSDIAYLLQMSELNFQSQHDSPFWFAETAGEVSRKLNSIVDLSVIDTALSNIASAARHAQERRNIISEGLIQAQQELEKIKDAETQIEDFKNLKEVHEKRNKIETAHHRLGDLLSDVNSRREWLKQIREREAEGKELLEACQRALEIEGEVTRLNEVIGRVVHLQTRSVTPPPFAPIEEVFNEWQDYKQEIARLSGLVKEYKRVSIAVKVCEYSAAAAERKFHQETKGKACPLCGKIS